MQGGTPSDRGGTTVRGESPELELVREMQSSPMRFRCLGLGCAAWSVILLAAGAAWWFLRDG